MNAPLFDIQVNFRDGGSTRDEYHVDHMRRELDLDASPATDWDTSKTTEDIEFVDEDADPAINEMTLVCTLVVDP